MEPDFLLKGLLIGFSVAAPVGPIGILTIRRTLAEGRLSGFATGMGAAVADMAYGMVAAFGLTAVSAFLLTQSFWLRLLGGLFLLYLGLRIMLSKPATAAGAAEGRGLLRNFVSTFFLTVTNPATILSFVAIFAGLGLGSAQAGAADSAVLVAGVLAGSALWWLLLSTVVGFFASRLTPGHLQWVNRCSGLIVIGFGLVAWYSCFTSAG